MDNIKVSKAYISAYLIHRLDDGKYYLAEQDYYSKEWTLFELDEAGDIYGYKEWCQTYATLKRAKLDVNNHYIL